jgi:hypothetical protein
VEDSSEHCNEPLGSIKCLGSNRVTVQLMTFQECLSSMKVVNWLVGTFCFREPTDVAVHRDVFFS